jgi:hypothetical protein
MSVGERLKTKSEKSTRLTEVVKNHKCLRLHGFFLKKKLCTTNMSFRFIAGARSLRPPNPFGRAAKAASRNL